MRSRCLMVVVVVSLISGKAAASNELNGLFDARSMGMGGTGVAFLDSAGAIPTNPALLDQIGKLTLTLNGFLFISQPEAPYRITHSNPDGTTYDNWETIRSDTIYAPLFFVGGAYRLHERIVVGAGFYPIIGQGTQASYKPAPELKPELEVTNDLAAGLIELGNAVSVKVTDTFALAAMWRITYLTQKLKTPLPGRALGGLVFDKNGNPVYGDVEVSGVNFGGFQLGLLWKASKNVRLGFSYRNKVVVKGEGTTTSTNPIDGSAIELETEQPFANPHAFRAGIAVSAMDDKFLFTTDVKYLMYEESWKTLDVTTVRDGKSMTTSTPLNWKDAFNVHLGSEYQVTDGFRARLGYIMSTTATPEDYAKAFTAPPGVAHCWTAGIGLKVLDQLDVDLAGSYITLRTQIYYATPDNAGAGIYASHTGELSLSATYHN
ncbi:MAG TPA: outer membrane protein transport protein [Polyangiales bacterium]|nr:outer membrane protein transport protein [Polyangiales bacterium]